MPLTKEDLQQIGEVVQFALKPIHQRLDKMDERFDKNEKAYMLATACREDQRKADKEEMKEFTLGAVKKLKAKFIQS